MTTDNVDAVTSGPKNGQPVPAVLPRTSRKKRAKAPSGRTKPNRPYPNVLLSRALEIPQKIKELNGGNPWQPSDIAAAIGIGPKTPDYYYITAAARDFGLTVGTRNTETISLTDLGKEIVYAPNSDVERQKKLEAFHNVELFSRVLKHYKGSNLPEMKYLGNTLEREFGLHPDFHEEFSQVFRDNCNYLKISAGDAATGAAVPPTTLIVGEPTKKDTAKVFVIMPFVERNPERSKGFFSEVLRSLITPAAVQAGFKVETANQQGSDVIQSTIVNELLDADLVVADLSDHNPNVLFELGIRMAAEKPVALIKAAGTGRVFDVDNMLRVVEYQPQLWRSTVEADIPILERHFRAAWDNRSKNPSYMKILKRAPVLEENPT